MREAWFVRRYDDETAFILSPTVEYDQLLRAGLTPDGIKPGKPQEFPSFQDAWAFQTALEHMGIKGWIVPAPVLIKE